MDGASGKFSVFNPNEETMTFSIEGGKGMFFNQSTGMIDANSRADIELTAFAEGNILVKFLDKELEPGIQIKVRKPDIPNYGIILFLIILGAGIITLIILFYFST